MWEVSRALLELNDTLDIAIRGIRTLSRYSNNSPVILGEPCPSVPPGF